MPLSESIIIQAVDRSIVETIEAFIRFKPGFHGDTGIRDYLYHRLMTNLPDGGTHCRADGGGTLLAQAEWYTTLNYCGTGKGSTRGRFDVGIPIPEEIDSPNPHPLVAFECGRNKKANSLVEDFDAPHEHEGPKPADVTKLFREIRHRGLTYGYALEFYDKKRKEGEELIRRLREQGFDMDSDRLRVVVVECMGSGSPTITFLPLKWEERLRQNFSAELRLIESLKCLNISAKVRKMVGTATTRGNRVTREHFLSSCLPEALALINAIENRFEDRVRLVFGDNTMTVNCNPKGKLLRIEKKTNAISDLEPAIRNELSRCLQLSKQSTCKITGTQEFTEKVLAAVGQAINGRG